MNNNNNKNMTNFTHYLISEWGIKIIWKKNWWKKNNKKDKQNINEMFYFSINFPGHHTSFVSFRFVSMKISDKISWK